jgi:hypothetical protein
VKLAPTGQGAWIAIDYIQAVVPGKDLGTAAIMVRDQGMIPVIGIADEIGLSIARMRAGLEPMVDLSEPKA